MLASGKIVGFVPTKDYDKARAFYEGSLGCEFISLDQYALVMSIGGHKIRIAKLPAIPNPASPFSRNLFDAMLTMRL
jgi:catechol 2,3-dioxygenase-like lactoylglutathione lyase family enzyme